MLSLIFNNVKDVIFPIVDGTCPWRLLLSNRNWINDCKFSISDGIVPVRTLLDKNMYSFERKSSSDDVDKKWAEYRYDTIVFL